MWRLAAQRLTRALGSEQTIGLKRLFTTEESKTVPKGGTARATILFGLVGAGGGLIMAKQMGYFESFFEKTQKEFVPEYGSVRKAIENIMESEDYDDGSYGPLLVRLAWHSAGTFDKNTNTGGSNGATMRFEPESKYGANNGLSIARDLLEPIKKQFPWISYADLWTLSGVVAIEAMGGPKVPWCPGRSDMPDGSKAPPDGQLPDGDKEASHLRKIFYRMGFDDKEIVALSGAHTLGRCHRDRSGWTGPWTRAPTTFSNLYFVELVNNKWRKKPKYTPVQYEDASGDLMMLPTDMALLWDSKFKEHVQAYAKDEQLFFKDFALAFSKLLELGVPFEQKQT